MYGSAIRDPHVLPGVYMSMDGGTGADAIDQLSRLIGSRYGTYTSPAVPPGDVQGNVQAISDLIGKTVCTILFISDETHLNSLVDVEIDVTLKYGNGLLALSYPGEEPVLGSIPARLEINLTHNSGYAMWHKFPKSERLAFWLIHMARIADPRRIRNY